MKNKICTFGLNRMSRHSMYKMDVYKLRLKFNLVNFCWLNLWTLALTYTALVTYFPVCSPNAQVSHLLLHPPGHSFRATLQMSSWLLNVNQQLWGCFSDLFLSRRVSQLHLLPLMALFVTGCLCEFPLAAVTNSSSLVSWNNINPSGSAAGQKSAPGGSCHL